jgi:hypothetical protein
VNDSSGRPITLSENHRRSISISLHLLDKQICQWERWVSGDLAPGAMYRQQNTLSALQKTQLRARIAKLRELIVRLRDDLQLEPDRPTTAQLIIGQATILWEMLAELNSSSLQGYGAVSPELAAYIDPLGEDLTREMHEISRLFHKARPTRTMNRDERQILSVSESFTK